MTLIFQQGKKDPLDKLYSFVDERNGNLYKVSFPEIAMITIQLMRNEDILYPPEDGFKGGKMLQEFLFEAIEIGEIPIPLGLLEKYHLQRHEKQEVK